MKSSKKFIAVLLALILSLPMIMLTVSAGNPTIASFESQQQVTQNEESDEWRTFLQVDVIDYRGGRDWSNLRSADRAGIYGVEINVYINGLFATTISTNRHGTAMFSIQHNLASPPIVEVRIIQAEGFQFDGEKVRIDLDDGFDKDGDVIYYVANHRWILHPVDPDIPLGGADIQWVLGRIGVLEYGYVWSIGFESYVNSGYPIVGAEVNVYVNGEHYKTVVMEGTWSISTVPIEIRLPSDVEPEVGLRVVRADGFQFDSELVYVALFPDRAEDNVLNFHMHRWGLHPIEDDTPPATTPNLTAASSWAREGISEALALDLVPQPLQNYYTNNITRAEFTAIAVLLYETITGTEITGRVTFNDTADINIQKAAYLGIITGTGNNNFSPNMPFNREQAAVIISRLAEAIGQPLPTQDTTFADNAEISSWAIVQVGQAQAAEIMGGVGSNRFNPQGPFTREQSIITMLRLFDFLEQ